MSEQRLGLEGLPLDEPERRVLVIDAQQNHRGLVVAALVEAGFKVRGVDDGFKAAGLLGQWPCGVVLVARQLPLMDGLKVIERLTRRPHAPSCLVLVEQDDSDAALDAMERGAAGFVTRSTSLGTVVLSVKRAFERRALRAQLHHLRHHVLPEVLGSQTQIIGQSAAVEELRDMIEQVASSKASVLIMGESGTGKELVARLIHERSQRKGAPFVVLHCAALAESVLESELFGHERGAFTGASAQRVGRFELAHGGTLFLDEIGELSLTMQVKLLRFLQQRQFERVGGNKTISVDVRLVAATHRNLMAEVKAGRFREDLYYRLNVICIETPPLRQRPDDIELLMKHFLARSCADNNKELVDIDPQVVRLLKEHPWPGNVRELENVMERAVVLMRSGRLEPSLLPVEIRGIGLRGAASAPPIPGATLEELERYAILRTYEAVGGSTAQTAKVLDISVRKVRYKLRQYAQAAEAHSSPEGSGS